MMRVMRELWTSDMPAFRGANWHLDNLRFSHKLVGGATRGAIRPAANVGRRLASHGLAQENYRAGAEQIK
jgi:hypothetical protein